MRRSTSTEAAFEEGSVIGFKGAQAGVEQFSLWDDDNVVPGSELIATEDLSNQSFRSVSLNGPAELLGGRDPQPPYSGGIRRDEYGAVAAMHLDACPVHMLKLGSASNAFVRAKIQSEGASYSLLTVRRFRPFARRRFKTSRPFLVLMRTRNPCVFLR
jgi:hypothetical protein